MAIRRKSSCSRLAPSARSTPLRTAANIGNFYAKGSGQIYLMILLLHEDLPDLLRQRVFSGSVQSLSHIWFGLSGALHWLKR